MNQNGLQCSRYAPKTNILPSNPHEESSHEVLKGAMKTTKALFEARGK